MSQAPIDISHVDEDEEVDQAQIVKDMQHMEKDFSEFLESMYQQH